MCGRNGHRVDPNQTVRFLRNRLISACTVCPDDLSKNFGSYLDSSHVHVKLSVPGRPTIWMTVGQGPIVLAVGAGGG